MNRRKFLKIATIAAVTTAVVGLALSGEDEYDHFLRSLYTPLCGSNVSCADLAAASISI
jgi:hypothetical protein